MQLKQTSPILDAQTATTLQVLRIAEPDHQAVLAADLAWSTGERGTVLRGQ